MTAKGEEKLRNKVLRELNLKSKGEAVGERLGAALSLREVPPQGIALPLNRQLKPLLGSPSLRPTGAASAPNASEAAAVTGVTRSRGGEVNTPPGVTNRLQSESRASARR